MANPLPSPSFRNHFLYFLFLRNSDQGGTPLPPPLAENCSLQSPWRLAESTQREAGWGPPPGLSVPSHRDTFCLSSSSAGSQSPSHLLHQGPPDGVFCGTQRWREALGREESSLGAECHQIICPFVLALLQDVLLLTGILMAKESLSHVQPVSAGGMLGRTGCFLLPNQAFLPSSLWLSWKALER